MLLDYNKFDLIKLLLRNHLKVVSCIWRARVEDEYAKRCIEKEVSRGGVAWGCIFQWLHARGLG